MRIPNVRQALRGLGRPALYQIIERVIEDHEVVDSTVLTQSINLVLHPMDPQKIAIKPEGERRWMWLDGWTGSNLEIGWMLVADSGTRYRIMAKTDWSQAGYYHYELIEGPRPPDA